MSAAVRPAAAQDRAHDKALRDIARLRLEGLGVQRRPLPAEPVGEVAPSEERKAHGPIERLERVIDGNGHAGMPYLALATLAQMERAGTITAAQRRAGERFHALFRRAGLDGLKAAALDRVPGGGGIQGLPGNERARHMVGSAIRALGGEGGIMASAAWHVLGLEWSLRDWSQKALRGNVDRASGVVIGVLALLEAHFSA